MIARTEDDLDRIFAEFLEDRDTPSPRPLTAWIADHPDLSTNLTQWASDAAALGIAVSRAAPPEAAARSLAIGVSVLARMNAGAAPSRTIVSLNDAARKCGSRPRAVADAVGIGITLFAKLNRRLIDAATIPDRLYDRMAEALRVSAAELRAYLALPPSLAEGAAYRSATSPEAVGGQSFADALHVCADMSEDQKREWQ